MNIAQTTELAALIATHCQHVIESPLPIPAEALQEYWSASRQQLLHWMNELNRLDNQRVIQKESEAELLNRDVEVQSILEEIFVTEILTRVWSALLCAVDQRQNIPFAEPVGRSVWLSHVQARHRALKILVEGHLSPVRVGSLNKLRRRCERWTDLLLGQLAPRYDIEEYAFESQRLNDLEIHSASSASQPLLLAGIRMAFRSFDFTNHDVSSFHQQIISSIMASFPGDAFQQKGSFRNLAHVRIHRSSDREAEGFQSVDQSLLENQNLLDLSQRRFNWHDDHEGNLK